MKTNNRIINGVLKGNADAFIIPNQIRPLHKQTEFSQKRWAKKLDSLNEVNDIKSTFCDRPIQLWFTGMDSENIAAHGIKAMDEDGTIYRINLYDIETLPSSFFKGHKEGDIINIKFKCKGENYENEEKVDLVLDLDVTLNQLDYRYRKFGKFEEALSYVS